MWPGYQVVEVNRVGEDWILGVLAASLPDGQVDVDGDGGHR